jgi:predicted nucleotidyltransferase
MGEEESKLVNALKWFKEKICQKYDIREMILFGSQMRVEADENSEFL